MNKVLWHITMSLDGFIAGPDDAMDWAFEAYGGGNELADEIRRGTGAILAGRRWYDVATAKYDGVAGIYGGAWSGPVFVLTHRDGDDATVTFLSGGVEDAVAHGPHGGGGAQPRALRRRPRAPGARRRPARRDRHPPRAGVARRRRSALRRH